jgi:hypothetical protein
MMAVDGAASGPPGSGVLGLFSEHLVELGGSTSRVFHQRIHERTQSRRVKHVVRNVTLTEVSMWPDPIWPDRASPHRQVRQARPQVGGE